jgi:hypothetical protein
MGWAELRILKELKDHHGEREEEKETRCHWEVLRKI